ncbi:MAG: PaaI family thioesterase [Bacteroidales bacterium]|nr:PaaI family thioesterase [Bacteroidales bacterium]
MKKKVKNPFTKQLEYNCFGCCPTNPIGLKLEFEIENNEVVATWNPKKDYEGWVNILHGGIQVTLMDEIASWYVFTFLKTAGVTCKINVELKRAVYISDGQIKLKARLKEMKRNLAFIEVILLNKEEIECAYGIFTYYLYTREKAIAHFNFPEKENDFID